MKIRKAFQGTVPPNKILDGYSTSNTDTYSCNYVNSKENYIRGELSSSYSYKREVRFLIPYNTVEQRGNGLSLNNGILTITGDNIKSVIISAWYTNQNWTTANYYIYFTRSGEAIGNGMAYASGATTTMTINVKKGDTIKVEAYCYADTVISPGDWTGITIQAL